MPTLWRVGAAHHSRVGRGVGPSPPSCAALAGGLHCAPVSPQTGMSMANLKFFKEEEEGACRDSSLDIGGWLDVE